MKKCNNLLNFAMLLLVLPWVIGACEFPDDENPKIEKGNSISIMTWNMQALFDGEDDGNEYDDYLAAAGWSKEKYQGRISAISKAISGMRVKPDIIAVQEIESELVIQDLAASLAGRGYKWTHFANNPDMSLGIGILSSYPLSETLSHSININGDAVPRPVLEVRINTENAKAKDAAPDEKPLVFFICHWKSKLGGEALTEETRRASARVILRRMREIAEQEPNVPVIVLGDLNENHDEFYRRNGEAVCALLPDDPLSAEMTGFYDIDDSDTALCAELQKDFLIISTNKPPQAHYFSGAPVVLYTPWENELENGSYYYKNAWETIDHFLLSQQLFDESDWDFDSCAVVDYPPFTSAVGRPVAYNPRTGSGLSDHLPLLLLLKRE